ncbi:hypothetical protein [Pedobacter sp. Leaf132]|uniref:hypothetical protein n=1 Tax=Pedobacter sp. Leaf132 TaxID=2876557 RepID=UPI001E56AE4F|nr:hypothetical protein [Pedobacter sp. Leaf132]
MVYADDHGKVVFNGKLSKQTIDNGKIAEIGVIKQSLQSIVQAKKLILSVKIDSFENSWDFFVYPKQLPNLSTSVLITNSLNKDAIRVLNSGGKVLLTLPKGSISAKKGGSIAVGFSSIFWNTAWTKGAPPNTLGILCNPKHPAFAHFPADFHSNWQWWDAMSHSNAIILDSVAKVDKPEDIDPFSPEINFLQSFACLYFSELADRGQVNWFSQITQMLFQIWSCKT